ncbi:MAG: HRDC domain-containing protein, partial [Gemmatimonadetes bacterium]|nr:HRDC domain-containing protein [Gemmatimonadota bacterium]
AEDADGAFLRVKGARDLTRRELAVLRELVPWRDAVAREMDRSSFRVVSNDVLLEIARQAPTTRDALAAIDGAFSVEAVQEALDGSAVEWMEKVSAQEYAGSQ